MWRREATQRTNYMVLTDQTLARRRLEPTSGVRVFSLPEADSVNSSLWKADKMG